MNEQPPHHNRRRFLKLTVAGAGAAGLAGAGALAGADQAGAVTSGLTALTHPGVLHSRADLDRIRDKVAAGAAPWTGGYTVFAADFFSSSSYVVAGGRATVTRGSGTEAGNAELWYDCNAAYQNALMWYITGNTAHAYKSLEIIKSWTAALQEINGTDAELAAGIYGAKLAAAVEIMHYTGPAGSWSQSELDATVAMFKNVFVPRVNVYGDGAYGLMGLKGMLQIAVACNDLTLFNDAYNAFYTHSCCGLTKLVQSGTGQCAESGRTQGYTQLILGALAEICQTGWIQGLDMYGASGSLLLSGFEYTAKYNLGGNVPYDGSFGRCNWHWSTISSDGRGSFKPIYEMAYHHYVKRAGKSAPYTAQVASSLRPEGAPTQCDQPGFGTLLFSL
ncbi:alginate lyase family protein [Streptomyces justiciae]|uniref:Alginate lyase family protein n=1 Tax=Streptomyces justiciae TaxID=2780140 RepID=A0ABU3M5T0_9ACTN|nr:alginate lyase family protein [Streptomyces justiciae]MDT7846713.1 alginate lyase family protein [Streptomyces justiciae]